MGWCRAEGLVFAYFAVFYPGLAVLIPLAVCLDLLWGDPRWFPHPVVFIGKIISFLEGILRKYFKGATGERLAGILLAGTIVGIVFFFSWEIIFQLNVRYKLLGCLASAYLLYTAFSLRSLEEHILAIELPLKRGNLPGARRALSLIVGRDTEHLTETEISRAALESLAESAGDGVIAPLFYAFLGGPPLAMAYKTINTLDSMLGYRNERYFYFGWAAARFDDLANLIPARLTALFFLAAALVGGKLPPLQASEYCANILREGKKHFSPNSGYPEAAAALLLGVRLGGSSVYNGIPSDRPVINPLGKNASYKDLKPLRSLVRGAALLALITGIAAYVFAGYFLSNLFFCS